MKKKVTWPGVYGPHSQIKCLLKPFNTCEQNILIYSQMIFQLNQSHILTATGLNIDKKSINWLSVGNCSKMSLRWGPYRPYYIQVKCPLKD